MVRLVRRHRRPRPDAHRRQPGDPGGARCRTTRCCSCARHPAIAFIALGAVVLCVTGAEALYADMGHFGKRPIRLAWFGMVLPALMLNYFGQGALLLARPRASVGNPFFQMAPPWALYPLIALATCADRHRLAGADLGRVLDHQAGDPARLPAAPAHPAHLGARRPARSTCPSSTGACSSASSSPSSSASARATRSAPPTASR